MVQPAVRLRAVDAHHVWMLLELRLLLLLLLFLFFFIRGLIFWKTFKIKRRYNYIVDVSEL
jgi:hypothetical protein